MHYHSDAVLTYDTEGTLLEANDAALQLTGHDLASLQREGLKGMLTPSEALRMAEHMQQAAKGEAQNYDLTLHCGEHALLLNMRNVPLVIAGEIRGVYAIATDVTERAHAIDALRDSESTLRIMVAQQNRLIETIRQLSMPVLPVHDQVLLMPLIGQIDDVRGQDMLTTLLEQVEQQRARMVIIDITGVSLIDTMVVGHLLQATRAVQLLGAESVLVGITPEVAQTIVQLGADIGTLVTRSNLQAGVAYAIGRQARG